MLSDREGTMLALLSILYDAAGEPIGTRTAAAGLQERYATKLSESTVSRLLQEMDRRNWTSPVSTKGRVLAAEGRARHEKLVQSTSGNAAMAASVGVHTVAGLLELLHARKAVESAVAADAANNSTAEGVDELRRINGEQAARSRGVHPVEGSVGISFHRQIAGMGTNSMLRVLSGIVLAPQLDHIEDIMDIILDEQHLASSVHHHQVIIDAIAAADAAAAEEAMDGHFAEMIGEAEKYLVGRNAGMVERLLLALETDPRERPAVRASRF